MTDNVERLQTEKQQMSFDLAELRTMLFSANAETERLREQHDLALQVHDAMAAKIERLREERDVALFDRAITSGKIRIARSDALEAAAKVAEDRVFRIGRIHAEAIAIAIRALKEKL